MPSDGGDLARYLRGEAGPDPAVVEPWGRWVHEQRAAGKIVTRVRLRTGRPTDYVLFECEWVYTSNVAAGETIKVLDLTERSSYMAK